MIPKNNLYSGLSEIAGIYDHLNGNLLDSFNKTELDTVGFKIPDKIIKEFKIKMKKFNIKSKSFSNLPDSGYIIVIDCNKARAKHGGYIGGIHNFYIPENLVKSKKFIELFDGGKFKLKNNFLDIFEYLGYDPVSVNDMTPVTYINLSNISEGLLDIRDAKINYSKDFSFDIKSKSFSPKITSEKDFRDYAHVVMKKAHGDSYDVDTTNKVVDDLIKNNPDTDYGELIGRLTSRFGDKNFALSTGNAELGINEGFLAKFVNKNKDFDQYYYSVVDELHPAYDILNKINKGQVAEWDSWKIEKLTNSNVLPELHKLYIKAVGNRYFSENKDSYVTCNTTNPTQLMKILNAIKEHGNGGHSFDIIIDEGSSDQEVLNWDGDGADRIGDIFTNVVEFKSDKTFGIKDNIKKWTIEGLAKLAYDVIEDNKLIQEAFKGYKGNSADDLKNFMKQYHIGVVDALATLAVILEFGWKADQKNYSKLNGEKFNLDEGSNRIETFSEESDREYYKRMVKSYKERHSKLDTSDPDSKFIIDRDNARLDMLKVRADIEQLKDDYANKLAKLEAKEEELYKKFDNISRRGSQKSYSEMTVDNDPSILNQEKSNLNPSISSSDGMSINWSVQNPFNLSIEPWLVANVINGKADGLYVGSLLGDSIDLGSNHLSLDIKLGNSQPTEVFVIVREGKAIIFKSSQLSKKSKSFSAGNYDYRFSIVPTEVSYEMQYLIGSWMMASSICHLYHICDNKYAGHVALDEFYKEFPEKIDELAEHFLADNDKAEFRVCVIPGQCPIDYLTRLLQFTLKYVELNEGKIPSSYQSQLDEIVCFTQSILYKLKRLDSGRRIFSIKK